MCSPPPWSAWWSAFFAVRSRNASMSNYPIQPIAEMKLVDASRWRSLLSINTALQVLGAVLGLLGQWYVNHHNPIGFLLWLGSNAVLLWLQFRLRMFVLVGLHVVYFAMCAHGFITWVFP